MRKILSLLFALCLFAGGELLAQPMLSIGNQTACTGDTAFVGVQLNTAGQAIGAASVVIRWDSTTNFHGLVNVLPAFAPDFSWQQQGRSVRVSWFSTTPRTINGLWFQLRFSGGASAITFSNLPGDNELANAQGIPFNNAVFQPGQLSFQPGLPIQISGQPRDTTVAVGAQVTFQVVASQVTSYKWERSTDNGNSWTILSNDATFSNTSTATLGVSNVTATMNGNRFRARLSSNCQSLVLSQAAVLTIQQPGSTVISLSANPVCGQDTAILNMQAGAAINGVGAISLVLLFDSTQAQFVQISSPLPGLSNGLLTNRVGNRLFVSWFNTSGVNIPQGTFLQIRFRNVTGGTVAFDQSLPGNNEISNLSGNAFPLTLGSVQLQTAPTPQALLSPSGTVNSCSGAPVSLSANMATGWTYRWLRNNLPISGATSASFQASLSGSYRVIITNAAGCFDTSATTVLNIGAAIGAQITPAGPTTICSGASVVLNGNSGTGFIYSWLLNNVAISGANSATYLATISGSYRLRIQNSANCADTSAPVQVTVVPRPVAAITPTGPTTFCQGASVQLNANAGTGLTFVWLRNGLVIPGATTPVIQAVLGGDYRVIVSAGSCSDTSAITTIVVNPSPNAQISPAGPTSFCTGGSVTLNSTTGTGFNYTWLRNGVVISGATTASITATLAGSYRVRINTSVGCFDTSAAVSVVVNKLPAAVITPVGPTTFCQGGSVTLNATTGTALTYLWLRNGVVISGANSGSIQAVLAGDYRVVVSAASCADTSAITTVIVNPAPNAQITAAGPTSFCSGGSVVLNATTGTGFSYSWLLNGTPIPGVNGSSLTVTSAGSYRVLISAVGGCFDTSAVVLVVVNSRPTATVSAAGPTSFCPGGSVTLNANTGTGLTYIWQRNATTITGANTANIQATLAGDYRVIVTATGGCADTSASTTVSLLSLPTAQITLTGPTTFCAGDSVLLNANSGTGLTYVWLLNDTILVGDTNIVLVARNNGDYKVRVTNAAGCVATSAATSITVTPLPPAPALSVSNDTIFSSIGTGLLWFRNGLLLAGINDSVFIITQPGHYTALSLVGNCQSDSSNFILIDNVSLETINQLIFNIYPNPSEGRFNVVFEPIGSASTEVRIYSMQGKLIREIEFPISAFSERLTIDLDAAEGIYLIEVRQGAKRGYQRLLIRR